MVIRLEHQFDVQTVHKLLVAFAITKINSWLYHLCPFLRHYWTTRLTMDKYRWNLVLEVYFTKLSPDCFYSNLQ